VTHADQYFVHSLIVSLLLAVAVWQLSLEIISWSAFGIELKENEPVRLAIDERASPSRCRVLPDGAAPQCS
jgi:hypothetical protein